MGTTNTSCGFYVWPMSQGTILTYIYIYIYGGLGITFKPQNFKTITTINWHLKINHIQCGRKKQFILINFFIHKPQTTNHIILKHHFCVKLNWYATKIQEGNLRAGVTLLKLYRIVLSICGPGSSVGIATELPAGRSGIESRWERDIPSFQAGPGAHPASCTMGTGSFPGVKCGWGVLLTTHPPSSAAVMEE